MTVLADPTYKASAAPTAEESVRSTHTCTSIDTAVQDPTASLKNPSNDDNNISSFWHLLITLYLPILVMSVRRSVFGVGHVVRILVLGQLFRMAIFEHAWEWMNEKAPYWLQVLWRHSEAAVPRSMGPATATSAKYAVLDPHAWPPPAFTALALFTIFTLVVHPDGLTWILLGKIRDAIYSGVAALAQGWESLMDDYGLFPTIAALMTLASLIFLVFIIIRTLSPKPKQAATRQIEKKKKKKKGNSRKRDHHHRQVPAIAASDTSIESASSRDVFHQNENGEPQKNSHHQPALECAMGNMQPISESSASLDHSLDNNHPIASPPSVPPSASKSRPVGNGIRNRVSSVSTVETTALSDDQSYESTSALSDPSVGVSVSRSGDNPKMKNKSSPRRGKRGGGGNAKQPRGINRSDSGKQKGARNSKVPQVSSRWDALKPEVESANASSTKANSPMRLQQGHRATDTAGARKARGSQHPPSKSLDKNPAPRSTEKGGAGNIFASPSNGKYSTPDASGGIMTPVPSPPPGFDNTASPVHRPVAVHSSWEDMPLAGFATCEATSKTEDKDVLTALLHTPSVNVESRAWNLAAGQDFVPQSINGYVPFGGSETTKVQENPFDTPDSQIEAELQELGGRMAGSILDF